MGHMVASQKDNYRRAGIEHFTEAHHFRDGELDPTQIAMLKADKKIIVVRCDDAAIDQDQDAADSEDSAEASTPPGADTPDASKPSTPKRATK